MKRTHEVTVKPRQRLWDAVAAEVDAEMGRSPSAQDVVDIVATLGHVAGSAWVGYVPPPGIDLRGEEGFVEVMRMALKNVKPRENEV